MDYYSSVSENQYYIKVFNIRKEPYIEIIQENLIEFLVQYIQLIYTRLMIYAIQILVYSKDYTYYILLIYDIISFF